MSSGTGARELADEVVRALRNSDRVKPLDGFTAEQLDGWQVDLPEVVRRILLEVGGVEADDVRYEFGPRRTYRISLFRHGTWELGYLEEAEAPLLVGVDGSGRQDWGPVVAAGTSEDGQVTVLAPTFTHWLLGLAADGDPAAGIRYGDGHGDGNGDGDGDGDGDGVSAAARAVVRAVPSVEAAEGPDPVLAELVGRGDSLTDVADLRDLPGYPCRVLWEPYHSTEFNTADTGSSEVHTSMVGGGRALLLRSEVSGDFLGRPVRRHTLPADAADRAVAELRALAAESPEDVRLGPGSTDAEMDGWPVPVPAAVRAVFREIGSVAVRGLPELHLRPGAPELEVDPDVHRMLGGDGTYWPLARVEYGPYWALAQIRVDPDDGSWGCAVSVMAVPDTLREYPDLTFIGECLEDLLLTYARLARAAADRERAGDERRIGGGWLFPNTGEAWPRPVPVEEWAGADDPLLAAAAQLPPGTHAVDLRIAPVPSDVCFHRAEDWPWRASLDRLTFPGGGALVVAEVRRGSPS
ncbi:hypothetical protein [Streptomyces sp. NPDC012888]|uniref:hypothetical protein n=1 Tax=Streptomyces sp. NPDC012888 TaxID=3364855 RepID=UPI00369CDA65